MLRLNTRAKMFLFAIGIITLLSVFPAKARADTVVYTTRAAFTGAATNLTTITFEGIAAPNSVANFPTPLTFQGVTFSGPPGGLQVSVLDPGFFAPLFQFNTGAVLGGFGFIDVTLPLGIAAIGTDLMSTNPTGSPFQVVLSTGETFIINTPLRPERGFFGITTDVAIASIRFTTLPAAVGQPPGIPLLDNFSFGQRQAAPVPEPATMLLLSTGLAGLGVMIKRRRRSKKE